MKSVLRLIMSCSLLICPCGIPMASRPAAAHEMALNTPEARAIGSEVDAMLKAIGQKDLKALEAVFMPRARALWSNGEQYSSRDDILRAYANSFYKIREFRGRWVPDYLDVQGEQAWMTGEMSWSAQLIETGEEIHLNVRSTFIFQAHQGGWKIVYEHSSHRRSD